MPFMLLTNLVPGTSYFATVTLQGTGTVFLDFYNGQVDVQSSSVTLTSQPVTLTPVGAVSAYNQGLYVVALQASQKLGLPVSNDQIAAALAVYQGLYDPKLGYIRWLSTQNYKGPDVLAGDALSLFLWNTPLLSDTAVRNSLSAQMRTQYGMEDLVQQDGTSVADNQFLTLTNNPTTGAVEGIPEPGGWYQNGGSWLLWEFLAEYSAVRHGDWSALQGIQQSLAAEVAVTPLSKEFKVTINNPAIGSVDRA
jgi:hypothetical protein